MKISFELQAYSRKRMPSGATKSDAYLHNEPRKKNVDACQLYIFRRH